jgi:RNA polymerase sigma factor (sigma-70 family)
LKEEKHISLEKEWLSEYRATGDIAVLGQLYRPYMSLVYGVSLKYLKDREQAQDAVMAIFEELIVKIPKYDIDHFKSWLYVLSKHHCLMILRKKSSGPSFLSEEFAMERMENGELMHHEEESFAIEDQLDRLAVCMEKLKSEQKICVELFYLQKKSYQEIVATTSFELSKVKSYLQNGKRNLKQCIEERE